MWLTPYECLQFSLALRIPSAKVPTNKLVFLQHIFSLAITEPCGDKAVLGKHGEADGSTMEDHSIHSWSSTREGGYTGEYSHTPGDCAHCLQATRSLKWSP